MLNYHLMTVYAEYTACEHTYSDLLEAAMPHFASLCSMDAVLNPWCRHGIRFILTGAQGDLKWMTTQYGLHPYNRNECCSRCNASKNDINPCKTISCFTDAALFEECTHEEWCANHELDEWPIPMVHGVRLERFVHDVAHSQLLGTGKTHNGSCLTYLAESGHFNNANAFPSSGNYASNLHAELRVAFIRFRAFCKRAGLQANQPRFTPARLGRKNRTAHPCLASKAVSGKVISFWLTHEACERATGPGATFLDQLVATTAWSYTRMLQIMDESKMVLNPEQAEELYDAGMTYLRTNARLRHLSSRCKGKMVNRCLWTILPKHHHLWHALSGLTFQFFWVYVYVLQ